MFAESSADRAEIAEAITHVLSGSFAGRFRAKHLPSTVKQNHVCVVSAVSHYLLLFDSSSRLLEVIRVYVIPNREANILGREFRTRLSTHTAHTVRFAVSGAGVSGPA